MNTSDVVIIGAGHNGLVCAFYLARAGMKVTVLERRGIVGGAAGDRGIPSGFPQFGRELHPSRCSIRRSSRTWTSRETGCASSSASCRTSCRSTTANISRPARAHQGECRQVLQQRCRDAGALQCAARRDRRPRARADAPDAAERDRGRLDVRAPRDAESRGPSEPVRQALHAGAARPSRLVRAIGGRLSRRLVRERSDQGGLRLRRRRRQLREPVHAGLGLCAAASRARRSERQEGRLGPRHRRHGRDHPRDGESLHGARRRHPHRHGGEGSHHRERPRRGRGDGKGRGVPRAQDRLEPEPEAPVPQARRRPRRCRAISASASSITAAAPARSA